MLGNRVRATFCLPARVRRQSSVTCAAAERVLRCSPVCGQRQVSGRRRREHPVPSELRVNVLEHLAKSAGEPVVDARTRHTQLPARHVNKQPGDVHAKMLEKKIEINNYF